MMNIPGTHDLLHHYSQGVENFLRDNELLNIRRKELLYKKWQEKVYIPIRRQVESTIEQYFSTVDEEKRKAYLKYLNYKNKKVNNSYIAILMQWMESKNAILVMSYTKRPAFPKDRVIQQDVPDTIFHERY